MNSGRYGQPEEVAGLVEFLALDPAASYITGQVPDSISFSYFFLFFFDCKFQLTNLMVLAPLYADTKSHVSATHWLKSVAHMGPSLCHDFAFSLLFQPT